MTTATEIREGLHTVTPYLVVPGVPRLIDFLKAAFGAEEKFRMARPDGSIMHAEVLVGDSMIEMGEPEPAAVMTAAMPTALHYYVPDSDAVYARALEAGATSLYAPVDQFYGDREAGVEDPSGNAWYIATHKGASYVMPGGLRSVTPYLHPVGADRVLDFLKSALDAEEVICECDPQGVMRHAKIRIGDSIVEMSEAHGELAKPRPTSFHVYVDDADASYRRALDAGATTVCEPRDQFYGERMAGVADAAGNHWYLSTPLKGPVRGEQP